MFQLSFCRYFASLRQVSEGIHSTRISSDNFRVDRNFRGLYIKFSYCYKTSILLDTYHTISYDTQSQGRATYCLYMCILGLGKQSRSIFMQIDAKVSSQPVPTSPIETQKKTSQVNSVWPPPKQSHQVISDISYI